MPAVFISLMGKWLIGQTFLSPTVSLEGITLAISSRSYKIEATLGRLLNCALDRNVTERPHCVVPRGQLGPIAQINPFGSIM